MSAVTTLFVTVAAAAGAVALYQYFDRKSQTIRHSLPGRRRGRKQSSDRIIELEQDPDSGVYRKK